MRTRTRSQERLLTTLKILNRAISAQDLYIELRSREQSMGLATVYRSLEALKLEGMVQVRTLPNGEALYSLVQEDRHHLTCVQCGSSIAIDECPVHNLEEQLHKSYEFKIYYHMLEFFGLCTRCQTENNPRSESGQGS
ncbi:MAG: transcriptional repressor [Candidatus Parcubacteria bacterium]|uniref:Fur family transcriptional regulator n=1 Tax=Phormidesmis priestleyi TaxID=268141 RepID=UPI00083B2163|nr:Fur family transcriptional regulator [Phormidesmis priestleyi]MBC7824917.1 transcriptional repressor [Leptolyngbyaceae cyanobacterium LF-bin-113]